MNEEVSIVDEDGNTILHVLALEKEEEEEEIVNEIDEMMKDPNSKYHRLITQPKNDEVTPLDIASREGHLSVVEYLINHGAAVNKADKYGYTPLHVASARGHLSIVEYLINHGAAVNKSDTVGRTPLHIAEREEHPDIVAFLKAHGGK